jgi:hypothetical protein
MTAYAGPYDGYMIGIAGTGEATHCFDYRSAQTYIADLINDGYGVGEINIWIAVRTSFETSNETAPDHINIENSLKKGTDK